MSDSRGLFSKSCDVCYRRKVKCDRRMPRCQHCVARNEQCTHANVFRVFTLSHESRPKYQRDKPASPIKQKPINGNQGCFAISIHKKDPLPLTRHLGMLNFLLNNSFIDLRNNINLSKDGHMDYIGSSPMGLIITMYVVYHSTRSNRDPLQLASHAFPRNSLPPMDLFRGFDFNSLKDHVQVANECLSAYFHHFHPFCPLVDKEAFLADLGRQPLMLVNIMCAVGQTYLSHVPLHYSEYFTSKAMAYIKPEFLSSGSLSKLAALLLLGHFQHSPTQFGKSWFNLGLAFRMALSLGLDRPPPPNCPRPLAQLRFYLWSWCHILDKGFSFGLNRPWYIYYQCHLDPPALKSLFSSSLSDPHAADNRCTFLYTHQFSIVSHLLSVILCHVRFTENLQQESLERQKRFAAFISKKLSEWRRDMLAEFDAIVVEFPFSKNVNKFRSNLDLIYQGTLVQLFQSFTGASDPVIYKFYYEESIAAAVQAVRAAHSLGDEFSFSGNTYRFYCLSTAVLFLLRVLRETDHNHHDISTEHFLLGMDILKRSQSAFLMAMECYRMIEVLARAEGEFPEKAPVITQRTLPCANILSI
ncbi:hypothetical protein DSO57_1011849 [Entomophthora muscae]|uniref:Uncharacterized protein n=1 Tax=Entomophthora muscae TaxID=34485 RepID=A0ACC2S8G3_9FUNG|nr:hypothetical protein DSO57_1011849 [Entomophthora muscae]